MHVLVTGAAGFIGSHLCERLLNDGHSVTGVDGFLPTYDRAIKEANLATARANARFRFVELDLCRDPLDPAFEGGVDAIIHEAARPGLPKSWDEFEAYATGNVLALWKLLEACGRHGVGRIIHASTSSVYGAEAIGDETMPTRPVSAYGVTKLGAEQLLQAWAEGNGVETVILRYFSIFGPRQRPDMAYHRFAEALIDERPLTVYGDGEQSRSNTYVADCVDGTVRALTAAPAGEIYNIGGGDSVTVLDAIRIIAEALGVEPVVHHEPARVGDQRHTKADVSKAAEAFGYQPSTSPEAGLRAQVQWHLTRREAGRGTSP
jgi:nucleoside-diphosphate-sugar epimerase